MSTLAQREAPVDAARDMLDALAGPRHSHGSATGLDRIAGALASSRCQCARWSIVLKDTDRRWRCLKCGKPP